MLGPESEGGAEVQHKTEWIDRLQHCQEKYDLVKETVFVQIK